jgi:hypothetical protein
MALNLSLGSKDGRKFTDYKLLKGSAPWSYLYIKADKMDTEDNCS